MKNKEKIGKAAELRDRILDLLLDEGVMDRTDICQVLDIKWTTAYDNLKILLEQGFVYKYSGGSNGERGRPNVYWEAVELD